MAIRLSEHKSYLIRLAAKEEVISSSESELVILESDVSLYESIVSKPFNKSSYRYSFENKGSFFELKADYCIGVDWLGKTGKHLYVEPKINNSNVKYFNQTLEKEQDNDLADKVFEESLYELDYLKMLLQVTSIPESNAQVRDLLQIDWIAEQISIEQNDDKLTPFLIIRFLQTLKEIVSKGLKKKYYRIQENLKNRVKGKILVGQNIKKNVFKNRLTSTYCEYEVFGENNLENRFLKKALRFVISYVENNKILLAQNYAVIQDTIRFCRPAFELISDDIKENDLKQIKHNPFYNDYKDALQIGGYILKSFAYNITETSKTKVKTPPFWIDMPRLFELFAFSKMIENNPELRKSIHFQFATYGNSLDILVSDPDHQMIIDTKYKLNYKGGHLHEDIRQVSGYGRLKKVREKLKIEDDRNIECLIIYPDAENGVDNLSFHSILQNKEEVKAYHKVYKLGIKLPLNQL